MRTIIKLENYIGGKKLYITNEMLKILGSDDAKFVYIDTDEKNNSLIVTKSSRRKDSKTNNNKYTDLQF